MERERIVEQLESLDDDKLRVLRRRIEDVLRKQPGVMKKVAVGLIGDDHVRADDLL